MMHKNTRLSKILSGKIVSIVRQKESKHVLDIVEAIYKGGITAIEVTSNTPQCFDLIKEINQNWPEIMVGVGTVTDRKIALDAINAGAKFLVTPITNKKIVKVAHHHDIPVLMGAFTPTEIYNAAKYGADAVKLFPAGNLGLAYMKAVMAPLSDVPIIPTGGININNACDWLEAGAVGLGIGNAITNTSFIQQKEFEKITALAAQFVDKVKPYQN